MDAVQEGAFVRIRSVYRNMEEALRKAGAQVTNNIVQFYIEPRTVSEVGPKGSENYLQLGPKHFYLPVPKDEEGKVLSIDDMGMNIDLHI